MAVCSYAEDSRGVPGVEVDEAVVVTAGGQEHVQAVQQQPAQWAVWRHTPNAGKAVRPAGGRGGQQDST